MPDNGSDQLAMTLHGYFRSSAAYRVRIALNLKGLHYNTVPRHLRRGEQQDPRFLRINPQGLVPALVTASGAVITQSLAIIEYLEETHPLPRLLPMDPLQRARVRALAQICAVDIHPINNLRILRYLRHQIHLDEGGVQAWGRHWIQDGFAALETRLAREPETGVFCHGSEPGLADICLIPQVFNGLNLGVDLEAFPTIRRIYDAAVELDAFKMAHPSCQPDSD